MKVLWITSKIFETNTYVFIKKFKRLLPLFQNRDMMYAPGSKFHYNNAGFIILGLIIEEQTGLKFTEYIEKHI